MRPTVARDPFPCHPERSEGPTLLRRARGKRALAPQILVIVVLAMSLTAAAQSDTAAVETQRYDGHWWPTTSTEERTAFVTGAEECHTFDRKLVRKNRWSDEDFARAVDRYYQKNPSEASTPASLVMDKLNIASPISQPRRPGKSPAPAKTPHGIVDGTWWRSATGDEQLGYVEGYLFCRVQTRSTKPSHFSKRALDYVQITSTYYADDVKHEAEKLADVLSRFADPPPHPDKKHR
jgi:hypothetical protein